MKNPATGKPTFDTLAGNHQSTSGFKAFDVTADFMTVRQDTGGFV